MSFRIRSVVVSALFAALTVPASAIVVIDNFTQGAADLELGGSVGAVEAQQTIGNVPGGQRDVILRITSNPFQRTARFEIAPSQGMSFYSSGPGVVGGVGLDYDGIEVENLSDEQQTPGPGMNLNLSGENAFRFVFQFADLGVNVRVDAYTIGGGSSAGTTTVCPPTSPLRRISICCSPR
jgi:hypothetical protein